MFFSYLNTLPPEFMRAVVTTTYFVCWNSRFSVSHDSTCACSRERSERRTLPIVFSGVSREIHAYQKTPYRFLALSMPSLEACTCTFVQVALLLAHSRTVHLLSLCVIARGCVDSHGSENAGYKTSGNCISPRYRGVRRRVCSKKKDSLQ
jgi:hypothetical protein